MVIDENDHLVGTLAYPDIVGQLYRYCRTCTRGLRGESGSEPKDTRQPARVKDVMTSSVIAYDQDASLAQTVEGYSNTLSARF